MIKNTYRVTAFGDKIHFKLIFSTSPPCPLILTKQRLTRGNILFKTVVRLTPSVGEIHDVPSFKKFPSRTELLKMKQDKTTTTSRT